MNKTSTVSNTFGSTQVLGGGILLILLLGSLNGCISLKPNSKILTQQFSEPLGGASTSRVDIHASTGNLVIGRLEGNEEVLASGSLQYLENQSTPSRSVNVSAGLATFSLRSDAIGKLRLPLPWRASKGALEWQIKFNPKVPLDLTLYSGEGAVKADLAGMAITRVSAESGGGAVDVTLPDNAAALSVLAKTGGGNVTVLVGRGLSGKNLVNAQTGGGKVVIHLPSGLAARITAATGWGKVRVESTFVQLDPKTYQSADYESASDKVEISLASGAGDVTVDIQ